MSYLYTYTYTSFKNECLIQDLRDRDGKAKHTRLIKDLLYKFNAELKEEFGFDLHTCSECKRSDELPNGTHFMMELHHDNGIVNDSRITNLVVLCPICHQRTPGYCNRSVDIEEYYKRKWRL